MKKWDIMCLIKANDIQCQNCGEMKYGFFAHLQHYKHYRNIERVCALCIKTDFSEVKNEFEILNELYWLWMKDNDGYVLGLQDFSLEALKYLIEKSKREKDWKYEFEVEVLNGYKNFHENDLTMSMVREFFMPFIEFQRSLGEWN